MSRWSPVSEARTFKRLWLQKGTRSRDLARSRQQVHIEIGTHRVGVDGSQTNEVVPTEEDLELLQVRASASASGERLWGALDDARRARKAQAASLPSLPLHPPITHTYNPQVYSFLSFSFSFSLFPILHGPPFPTEGTAPLKSSVCFRPSLFVSVISPFRKSSRSSRFLSLSGANFLDRWLYTSIDPAKTEPWSHKRVQPLIFSINDEISNSKIEFSDPRTDKITMLIGTHPAPCEIHNKGSPLRIDF